MIATQVNPDDLSTLPKLFPDLMLALTFGGADQGLDSRTAIYRRLYVRLMDKAVVEYTSARSAIVAQAARDIEEMTRSAKEISATTAL